MSTAVAPKTQQETRVQSLIQTPAVKKRFEEMLGEKSPAFLSSVISAVNSNPALKDCDPMSVIGSAAIAAAMDLPINASLGFAHIVPYKGVAQFQMGWKGFVQLAMRSGQYKTINATAVLDGQLKDRNPFTGEMEFQRESISTKQIGYLLYFRLLNGFEKYFYMSAQDIENHAARYSMGYKKGFGPWKDDFEAMALKTVVKLGLSKYGLLSLDMQKAVENDQAEVTEQGPKFIDSTMNSGEPQLSPSETSKTKPAKLGKIIEAKSREVNPEPGSDVDAPEKEAPPI